MKIIVKYEFEVNATNPFFATTELNGKYIACCSDKSFDEARKRLVSRIETTIKKVPTIIPEPEEVETGDTTCLQCSGTGEVDELDKSQVNSKTVSPPYYKAICNECEGTGKTKEEK